LVQDKLVPTDFQTITILFSTVTDRQYSPTEYLNSISARPRLAKMFLARYNAPEAVLYSFRYYGYV